MPRASLLTLIVSIALGIGLGLYIGWVVSPVRYVDTDPASLRQAYKDDYLLMIATTYAQDHDLASARVHLTTLGFNNPGPAVAAAVHRFIVAQGSETDLRRLVGLAAAFEAVTPEMQPYLP